MNEIEKLTKDLGVEGLRDMVGFGRLMLAERQVEPPPPSEADWVRCPRWLKLKILMTVFYYTSSESIWKNWLLWASGTYHKDCKK